ncbi:hypothetical protein D3C81_1995350 [compost metagenome]
MTAQHAQIEDSDILRRDIHEIALRIFSRFDRNAIIAGVKGCVKNHQISGRIRVPSIPVVDAS